MLLEMVLEMSTTKVIDCKDERESFIQSLLLPKWDFILVPRKSLA